MIISFSSQYIYRNTILGFILFCVVWFGYFLHRPFELELRHKKLSTLIQPEQ